MEPPNLTRILLYPKTLRFWVSAMIGIIWLEVTLDVGALDHENVAIINCFEIQCCKASVCVLFASMSS